MPMILYVFFLLINGSQSNSVSDKSISFSSAFCFCIYVMVLGSFQCRGVLLLLHLVGQGPAVLAAGAGRVGYIFFYIFHLPFLMPCLLGDG